VRLLHKEVEHQRHLLFHYCKQRKYYRKLVLVDFDIIFEAWMQSNFTTSSSGEEYNNEYKLKLGTKTSFRADSGKRVKQKLILPPPLNAYRAFGMLKWYKRWSTVCFNTYQRKRAMSMEVLRKNAHEHYDSKTNSGQGSHRYQLVLILIQFILSKCLPWNNAKVKCKITPCWCITKGTSSVGAIN